MAQSSLLTQNAQSYALIVSRESMQLDTPMDQPLWHLDTQILHVTSLDTSMDHTQSALSNVDHTIDSDKQMDPDIACSDTQIADQQLDKSMDHTLSMMMAPLNAYYPSIVALLHNFESIQPVDTPC